jgi:glycosyltransferase involved in cell wall biosynthesis
MSEKIPTFSIVTPSFNQGKFIEQTITSILGQAGTFNLEYIVADGGSTDNSVDIIKKYAQLVKNGKLPVKCKGVTMEWWSHKDNGQSDAINQGWEKVTGDYVAYLNSDDMYLPGALEEARKAFAKYPKAGAVYSSWIDVDEKGREVEKHTGVIPFDLDFQINTGNILPQPATFIRKSALDDIGLLNPKYHYAMDYDLWTRLGQKYLIQFVGNDHYWAEFRFHEDSKTITVIDKFWPEVREISRVNGGKFFSHLLILHWAEKAPWVFKPLFKVRRALRLLVGGKWQEFGDKAKQNIVRLK